MIPEVARELLMIIKMYEDICAFPEDPWLSMRKRKGLWYII